MRLKDEEKRIKIKTQMEKIRMHIDKLHLMLKKYQDNLSKLELDLIRRTPTVFMPAVKLPAQAYRPDSPSEEPSITIEMVDLDEMEELEIFWEELKKEDGEM